MIRRDEQIGEKMRRDEIKSQGMKRDVDETVEGY
jgi:hypothetical protein